MRSRDAESLVAKLLTGRSKCVKEGARIKNQISDSIILGLQRSKPIYERKRRERESISPRQAFAFYRTLLSMLTYPIKRLRNLFKARL